MCQSCMCCMTDSHFATFRGPFSSAVLATHQYIWFSIDFFHAATSEQSLSFDSLSIFLPVPKFEQHMLSTFPNCITIAYNHILCIYNNMGTTSKLTLKEKNQTITFMPLTKLIKEKLYLSSFLLYIYHVYCTNL